VVDGEGPHGADLPLVWVGPTRVSVVDLGPDEGMDLRFKARVAGPGVYNLNQFRVVMNGSSFHFPQHCLVTVESTYTP